MADNISLFTTSLFCAFLSGSLPGDSVSALRQGLHERRERPDVEDRCPRRVTRREQGRVIRRSDRKRESDGSPYCVKFGLVNRPSTIGEILVLGRSASREPIRRQELCEMVQVDIIDVLFASKVVLHCDAVWCVEEWRQVNILANGRLRVEDVK